MTASGAAQPAWTDRDGHPVAVPEPPAAGSDYRAIGEFQAGAYERNAFAQGTDVEAAWLRERLGIVSGTRVVDVGCGTGRHARLLAQWGADVIAVDVAAALLAAGRARRLARQTPEGAGTVSADGEAAGADAPTVGGSVRWVQADATALPVASGWADVVISLCQGGFGLTPAADRAAAAEVARVLRGGGRLALTVYSLAFAARYLAPDDAIDLPRGLVHSPAAVRDADGHECVFDLWTACYSPAHVTSLLAGHALQVTALTGCEPGAYTDRPPIITDPEFMVQARSTKNDGGVVEG